MMLVDTSAWAWRERDPKLRESLAGMIVAGLVATCDAVKLELLYSARNADEFGAIRSELEALAQCQIGEAEWRRALDVYAALAAKGGMHQRQVKHMDLLIAAAAESAGIAVVHRDEDFDRIAAVTGQEVRWAA